jgi:hypothetical protein
VPLGGVRDRVAEVRPKAPPPSLPAVASASPPPSADEASEDTGEAEEVEVSADAAPSPPSANASVKAATPGAFQVKPYVAGQSWTRVVDIDVALKVGPGGNADMKMATHQEARFEVVSVNAGGVEKLGIEYQVYTSKLTFMGSTQDSPEELAGKRFVITFNQGKPDVRDTSGGTPPKKQVDSVKDDAREPLEIEKALKELASLTAKGRGDFSAAGAVALAGGEDEDTKVTGARGALQKLLTSSRGERTAVVDLGYTLTSKLDDSTTLEATVSGSLSVVDAPSRFQTSTLQGPMELRSSEPGGLAGRGTIKVLTSYRY